MEIMLFRLAFVLTIGIWAMPKSYKTTYTAFVQLIASIPFFSWAIQALIATPITVQFFSNQFVGTATLRIDALSALFLIIINITSLLAGIYAIKGNNLESKNKHPMWVSLHHFAFIMLQLAMSVVCSLIEVFPFLYAWELMMVASFVLILFHAEKKETVKIAVNYLIQMHAGFMLILAGFFIAYVDAGPFTWDSIALGFKQYGAWPLSLLFIAGFGVKAGIMPLHTWLPYPYPIVPAHVSAVLSGAMIKVGLYGILRTLSYIEDGFTSLGITMLISGIFSALLGVTWSVFQKNINKVLAYSSIENIGIIFIGIGMALIGHGTGNNSIAIYGLMGALLHIFNHALFKPMLFFNSGNVYYAARTRELDQLGGIAKEMPFTSIFFLVGMLALLGMPPFNGFVSEFLLYKGAVQNLPKSSFEGAVLSVSIMVGLALTGGIAFFSFSRLFGVSFLGQKRSTQVQKYSEVPMLMHLPSIILLVLMMSVALLPGIYIGVVYKVAHVFSFFKMGDIAMEIKIVTLLEQIGLASGVFIAIVGAVFLLRFIQQKKVTLKEGPTWGCGYEAGTFKHQYTGTSFSDSLHQLIRPVVAGKKEFVEFAEDEIFPAPRKFSTQIDDLIEEKTVKKGANWLVETFPKAGLAQTGRINHYLIYPLIFLLLIGLLSILSLI